MTLQQPISAAPRTRGLNSVIKLAILAVGGQGGGVLTSWIESLARSQGYSTQATSVAGVAQRTGATIYYIEMAPDRITDPVFALAPAPGDLDIMIAAEMMEAGRAILRGFVTPDRTTLIASSHRALAVSEKMVPGNGLADSDEVHEAARLAAKHLILEDLETAARGAGSVISASLFGALAGSGALPFERDAFEAAIRHSGKGVETSLRAFAAGFDLAAQGGAPVSKPTPTPAIVPQGSKKALKEWQVLVDRTRHLPHAAQEMAHAGLRKTVDFQDLAYGAEYLDHLDLVHQLDSAEQNWQLLQEAAKYIANAMAYDDVIRVADLKTRATRMARIRQDLAPETEVITVTDYLHPRGEEILALFPAGLGAKLSGKPGARTLMDRLFNKGRRLRSDRLSGFLLLYALGGLRNWRRRTLRHAQEQAHLDRWLAEALRHAPERYDLAVEILRCRRLIKGYSDTHTRGQSKFDQVLEGANLVAARDDAAQWVARLREAALQDEKGEELTGALQTIRSFL